jgi:hypothetical protein
MNWGAQIARGSERSWYSSTISDFLRADTDSVLGQLARNGDFALIESQRDAWISEIELLRSELIGLSGSLHLEFTIPRMGRRVDAIVLIGPVVFVLEFKFGAAEFEPAAVEQVWDYALDLKNFHEASHAVAIVPILIATHAAAFPLIAPTPDDDDVYRPTKVSGRGLREAIDRCLAAISGGAVDAEAWSRAPYHPTPTIVEAARALYGQHSVEAIARFDAGAKNLDVTSQRISEIVEKSESERRKSICFVTGVPGAGKTLVGLNVATQHDRSDKSVPAVFLSGNGPLVAVLREALTRDELIRRRQSGENVRKGKVAESVKAFIQNVHHFRDDVLVDVRPPVERVAIFDEAQRAWNLRKTADFMQRKKSRPGFDQSEPQFLISSMDRHEDWSVVICLVGGGQEINTGEAGIGAWLDAVNTSFPEWDVYISPRLTDSEYAAGHALEQIGRRANTFFDEALHLAVSMRSFRAESVSEFVKALLDCEREKAEAAFSKIAGRYPIFVTRDLIAAKNWIRKRARGSERFGLVASSKAQRLKPHAIDIRVEVDPVKWFLNERDDTRSSFYLEDAATEFQVQGLELDWTCVTWDGDLRFTGRGWSHHDFRGRRWTNIANEQNRSFLKNAYRVLLTRARQGMIIFVPPGEPTDPTRLPEYYDSTFDYLKEVGLPVL